MICFEDRSSALNHPIPSDSRAVRVLQNWNLPVYALVWDRTCRFRLEQSSTKGPLY